MGLAHQACVVAAVVGAHCAIAGAQPLTPSADEAFAGRWRGLALTKDCEDGFRRLMQMAQSGQLGKDVAQANVGIFKNHARVELVRRELPIAVLLLTPKDSSDGMPPYFSVEPGMGATAEDVARVARALDEVFTENPFRPAYDFFNASRVGAPIPGIGEAYASGGWRGVLGVLARHTAALASLSYTVAVLVMLVAGIVASVLLLWGSTSPR